MFAAEKGGCRVVEAREVRVRVREQIQLMGSRSV
jgi:hypothetical protein